MFSWQMVDFPRSFTLVRLRLDFLDSRGREAAGTYFRLSLSFWAQRAQTTPLVFWSLLFRRDFAKGVAGTVSLPIFSVFFRFFSVSIFFLFGCFFRVPIFSVFFHFLPFSSVFFPFSSVSFSEKKKKREDTVRETLFAKPRFGHRHGEPIIASQGVCYSCWPSVSSKV